MKLGIFSKTFSRPTLEESLDAIHASGFDCVQFSLDSAGLAAMPESLDGDRCIRIRQAMKARDVEMSALSGTFNMIHPNVEEREAGMASLRVLADACESLGTSLITISTGTRNVDNMWAAHPENDSEEVWREMIVSISRATEIAERAGVTLVFEPELSNVVNSAQKARRLLDEIHSPHLKVVIDGANLFEVSEKARMHEILDEAFDLIGEDIELAHAKDLSEEGFSAAGRGILDYDKYISLLKSVGFEGGLILHSLDESEVPNCLEYLKSKLF
ncbi:MAG: sugar phosphate isomerase/epimerase [Planctomycetota bacterium]|nr:sugar phosphate isomerase/epimerase [Planctomycetota bacterium]